MSIPAGYHCNQWGWFWRDSDNSGPYYLDADGNMSQGFPKKFYTDNDGEFARLRVDVGQTGFFAGRMFRSFQKLTIAALGTVTIRATVTSNIILHDTSFAVEGSSIEMQLRVGGSAAGPWTVMPALPMSTMTTSPVTNSTVTLEYDGAHTGGTVIDLVRVPADNKSSNISSSAAERGVGPGTYYYVISNTGNQEATVVFSGVWETRT